MSSGFDARVEARLIGLRMGAGASDGVSAIVTGSSNITLSNETPTLEETDNRSSLSDHSTTSSLYTSNSSNCSFSNNAPVTARRLLSFKT
jgi:hypothetical protein